MYYYLIMLTNPYPDSNFYINIRDETACINKYAPLRKLSPAHSSAILLDAWTLKEKPMYGQGFWLATFGLVTAKI